MTKPVFPVTQSKGFQRGSWHWDRLTGSLHSAPEKGSRTRTPLLGTQQACWLPHLSAQPLHLLSTTRGSRRLALSQGHFLPSECHKFRGLMRPQPSPVPPSTPVLAVYSMACTCSPWSSVTETMSSASVWLPGSSAAFEILF